MPNFLFQTIVNTSERKIQSWGTSKDTIFKHIWASLTTPIQNTCPIFFGYFQLDWLRVTQKQRKIFKHPDVVYTFVHFPKLSFQSIVNPTEPIKQSTDRHDK